MKRFLIAGMSALALSASGVAVAQDMTTMTIAPDHQMLIKEYVVRERIKPVAVDEGITLGSTVPENIELSPVPEQIYTTAPEVKNYRYFYWNNRVVFVDPDNRKVVDIVN